jgi:hypothetical protein
MSKVKAPAVKVDLPKVETKNPRTFLDIQQEFTNVCTKAGHLQYQITAHQNDLDLLNKQMRDLNLEAAAVSAQESKNE